MLGKELLMNNSSKELELTLYYGYGDLGYVEKSGAFSYAFDRSTELTTVSIPYSKLGDLSEKITAYFDGPGISNETSDENISITVEGGGKYQFVYAKIVDPTKSSIFYVCRR